MVTKEQIALENKEKFKNAARKRKLLSKAKQNLTDTDKMPEKLRVPTFDPKTKTEKVTKEKTKSPTLLPNGIVIPVEYPDIRALAVEKGFTNEPGEDGEKPSWSEKSLIDYLTNWEPKEATTVEDPEKESLTD